MNINYELYKVFYEIVINGSISKASEAMYISQPAVTQSIKNLEEKLGGKLLIRTKKGIVLTEEGKVLFDYVKKGVENFKNGENAFLNYLNLDSGSIRIGASTTITRNIVMPYLEKFHIKYPKVDIKITNDLTSNLVTALRNGELDLLVVNLPMEENKDLKVIPIYEVQDIFVGNLDYYNKTKGQIKIEDLFNYPLITQKEPSNTRRFLNKYLKSNNISTNIPNEIVSYSLIMDFVKAGFGIGYATKEFIEEDLNEKRLYEIKVTPKIPKREVGIVTLNKTIPNYSAKKLIELIQQKELLEISNSSIYNIEDLHT